MVLDGKAELSSATSKFQVFQANNNIEYFWQFFLVLKFYTENEETQLLLSKTYGLLTVSLKKP